MTVVYLQILLYGYEIWYSNNDDNSTQINFSRHIAPEKTIYSCFMLYGELVRTPLNLIVHSGCSVIGPEWYQETI